MFFPNFYGLNNMLDLDKTFQIIGKNIFLLKVQEVLIFLIISVLFIIFRNLDKKYIQSPYPVSFAS